MRIVYIICIILINTIASFSQNEGMPIVKNFKAETYEGGSRIYSLVCTKEGVLYAGDKNGILTFDGENWNKIDCGFAITSLAVDSNNVVYVAGSRGIGKLEVDSNHVMNYTSLNHFITTEKNLRKFRLSKVFNIEDKIVYTLGNEVVINTPDNIRIIESPQTFDYFQKLDNELYLHSTNEGIYKLVNNKLLLINSNEYIINKGVAGFIKLNDQLHAVIRRKGIYNLEEDSLISYEDFMPEVSLTDIQGIDQLTDSIYALKTFYDGVILFNNKGNFIKRYHFEEGIANNTVFSVIKDYWNNLWIGTASGISTIPLDFAFSKYNNYHGIGTGYASILYKDSLYLATSQGLYNTYKDSRGHLKFNKLFDGHIWSLCVNDDLLYFGSPKGIYSWNTHVIKPTSYFPGGWNIANIPSNEDYFITGSPAGMLLLKKDSDDQLKHAGLVKGVKANIRKIEFDKKGYCWAEYEKGIYRIKLTENLKETESIVGFDRIEVDNKLKKLIKYKDDLYFLADSGIYSYNNVDGFIKDTLFNRFYHIGNPPSNIVIDQYDRWWTFKNGDLFVYSITNKNIKKLTHGLLDYANETYPIDFENVFCLDSNNVIIGQEEGFLGVDLAKKRNASNRVYTANRVRKIIVTTKKGKVEQIKGEDIGSDWEQQGIVKQKIKHGGSIKFYYSAGCSRYRSIEYSTFLQGYDEKWPGWNNETMKEYTNLPGGKYKFVVRSSSKSNEESIVAVYSFEVLPPWYLTLVAKICVGLLVVLLVYITERRISYRTKKVKLKLQREQDELIYRKEQEQIQENLKKKQEIVKLKNEKLRIDNLYKSKELANSTMGVIKKNQFLTELKEELEKIKEYAEKNKLVSGDVRDVIRKIDRDIDNEENWKVFEDYFDRVHEKFLNRLKTKYPILTAKDLRLSAYLRMNLSTKEIAPLMNITVRGVEISRYRLRKKMEIDRNENLNDFLMKF